MTSVGTRITGNNYYNIIKIYFISPSISEIRSTSARGRVIRAVRIWAFALVGVIRRSRSVPRFWVARQLLYAVVAQLRNAYTHITLLLLLLFGRAWTECVSNAYLSSAHTYYIYLYIHNIHIYLYKVAGTLYIVRVPILFYLSLPLFIFPSFALTLSFRGHLTQLRDVTTHYILL